MKTIYLLVAAAGLFSASCQDDAADVKPAYAVNADPRSGERPESFASLDLMTVSSWSVDTLSRKVISQQGVSLSDTSFIFYGKYKFQKPIESRNGRQDNAPQQLIHTHPNWSGHMVVDTLNYYFGDYDAGTPSANVLTVWKGDAATAHKIVFTQKWSTKRACKFESRTRIQYGNNPAESIIAFTISR